MQKPRPKSNLSSIQKMSLSPVERTGSIANVIAFSATSDSNVVTVSLLVEDRHTVVNIFWGDKSDINGPQTVDLRKERMASDGSTNPNSLRIQHAYEINTLRRFILVEIIDSGGNSTWKTAVIDLQPRYKLVVYPVQLEIHGHPETDFEENSEFDIVINVFFRDETYYSKVWQPSVKTFFNLTSQYPAIYTLEGSEFSLEMLYEDYPPQIRTYVKEKDNKIKTFFKWLKDTFTHEFDTSNTVDIEYDGGPFHPRKFTGYKEIKFSQYQQDTSMYLVFRTEINLIVPLDPTQNSVLAPLP